MKQTRFDSLNPHEETYRKATPLPDKQSVARMFDVTTRTVNSWMRSGRLGYLKIGGIVRFEHDAIERLKASFRVHAQ